MLFVFSTLYQIKSIKLSRQKGDKFHLISRCTLIDSARKSITISLSRLSLFYLVFPCCVTYVTSTAACDDGTIICTRVSAATMTKEFIARILLPFRTVDILCTVFRFFALTSSSLCLNPIYVIFTRQVYNYPLFCFIK